MSDDDRRLVFYCALWIALAVLSTDASFESGTRLVLTAVSFACFLLAARHLR